jgi:hypothetical protein
MGRPQDRRQRETLKRYDANRGPLVSDARKLIYEKNLAVGSAPVERILKPVLGTYLGEAAISEFSTAVPNTSQNSFSDRLGPKGFNIFCKTA